MTRHRPPRDQTPPEALDPKVLARRVARRRELEARARRQRRIRAVTAGLCAIAGAAIIGVVVTNRDAPSNASTSDAKTPAGDTPSRPAPTAPPAVAALPTTERSAGVVVRPPAALTRPAGQVEASRGPAARPPIVQKPIPFGPDRKAETVTYSRLHYGPRYASYVLQPKVIVEHYTASNSFSSAWSTFASNTPDHELGQLPGTCAHFIIDSDGTIYQLVPTTIRCRHTVGLNYLAIGIEHVGTSDQQILSNPRQLGASLRLTRWLMSQYRIPLHNVIGHNESLSNPYHLELYRPWARQTHGDWTRRDMDIYRRRLVAR